MKRGTSEGRRVQSGRRFHGFTALKKNLICEITCGARLTPSHHAQATSSRTSDIVMGVLGETLTGLAGGTEDGLDFSLEDDPFGTGHTELAGYPACRRR